jgi:hypothetical protein
LTKLPHKIKKAGFTGKAWTARKCEMHGWYQRVEFEIEDGVVVKETAWPANEKCVIVNEIEHEVALHVTGGPGA